MAEPSRVRVHIDKDGKVAELDIDGQVDPEDIVEETPGKPTDPPREDIYRPERFWGGL
jgi:hypothetical protein